VTLRLKQLAQDSAAAGQVLLWNGSAWVPSRGRLISTPVPGFGGAPPAVTYSLGADELVKFNDAPFITSATFTLPAAAAQQPGTLAGVYLPLGNANASIVFAVTGTDVMSDPTSSTEALQGPGAGVTIAAGTFTGATLLVFEAVPTPTFAEWRFRADRSGSGGGGGPSTFAVTGVGQAGPGNNIPAPFLDERNVSQASAGGSAWVDVGAALYTYLAFNSTEDKVIVRARGVIKYTSTALPQAANTTLEAFELISEWTLSSGGDVESVFEARGSAVTSTSIRYAVNLSGPARELFLQVNEGSDSSLTVSCDAVVEVIAAPGQTT